MSIRGWELGMGLGLSSELSWGMSPPPHFPSPPARPPAPGHAPVSWESRSSLSISQTPLSCRGACEVLAFEATLS